MAISKDLIKIGFRLEELDKLSATLGKIRNNSFAKVWAQNFRLVYDREKFLKDCGGREMILGDKNARC